MRVVAGSALDFSYLNNDGSISSPVQLLMQQGRTVNLAINQKKKRLFCAVMPMQDVFGGVPNHQDADSYAEELYRRGYNMVRFVSLQDVFMAGQKIDFDYDEDKLDRWFYFLAALKKRGVYWQLDVVSWENGGYAAANRFNRNKSQHLIARLYSDSQAMQHWQKIVKTLLLRKNPYTGGNTLTDPALALVTLVNENDLLQIINITQRLPSWIDSETQEALNDLFMEWLHTHNAGLYKQAKDQKNRLFLRASIDMPWSAEVTRFAVSRSITIHQQMRKYLRQQGYQGLLTGMNSDGNQIGSAIPRQTLDVLTSHAYHDLPQELGTLNQMLGPKRKHSMLSSTSDSIEYLRRLLLARQSNKPFVVDEYNHAFPNPWRREAALLVPSYAAFQGWDGICRFARPVELAYGHSKAPRNHYITAFGVGMDPIARGGESVAAMLFLRRDVQEGRSIRYLELQPEQMMASGAAWQRWPKSLGVLGLNHRIALDWSARPHQKGAKSLTPNFFLQSQQEQQKELLIDTEPSIYNTPEGQIHIVGKQIVINTARTEAVSFEQGDKVIVSRLRVQNSDSPGLVAVSALDDYTIMESRHLLLVYLTDAHNTDMKMSGKTLVDHGHLPVLLRSGQVQITLNQKVNDTCNIKMYSLSMQGTRMEQVTSMKSIRQNKLCVLDIHLNTATLKHPALYFELVRH